MNPYVQFLVLSLGVGVISLTLSKGTIFEGVRSWIEDRSEFFGELIQCPYCTSHWISLAVVALWQPRLTDCGCFLVDMAISVFAMVAVASLTSSTIFRNFTFKKD